MKSLVIFFIVICSLSTGCAHHQLRFQLSKQAETVQQTFEKQVLNNLAMYSVKSDGIPYLTIPTEGATNVDGSASMNGDSPLNPFFRNIGLGSSRTSGNSWTLTPIVDHDKLGSLRSILLDTARNSDWLGCSNRRSNVPKCCTQYGEFCGTYVWVIPGHESNFADLILLVIKTVTTETAVATKLVTVFIDADGKPTKEENAVGSIVSEIELSADPIKSLTDTGATKETLTYEFKSTPTTPFLRPNILQLRQQLNTLGGSSFRSR